MPGLRILWVATKPPLPAVDGGRLLTVQTVRALAAAGHQVTMVAPADGTAPCDVDQPELGTGCRLRLVASPRRAAWIDFLAAELRHIPYTLMRHHRATVGEEVERLLAAEAFDVVHAEQLQSMPQAIAAVPAEVPLVLRAQNVESVLWEAMARHRSWGRPFLRRQALRLAAWEGSAVRRAAATVALTEDDAARLRALAGEKSQVVAIPAPFPAHLPSAAGALGGEPPLVLFASGGWRPNRDQIDWFLSRAWPRVRAAAPGARLHLFGAAAGPPRDGCVRHPAPADSAAAFPPGSVFLVPLRVASGVRMKILEAWARGVPVVASPAAAAGLEAEDGRELLLAADGEGFACAVSRLRAEPRLGAALAAAGRQALVVRHDPARVADLLATVYREAIAGAANPAAR